MQLQEDLYNYPWESMVENNCNSYLIAGEVVTLIDPGHHHLFPQLEKALAEDGFSRADIQLIIATHPHPDHFEAVEDFLDSDTLVALHPEAEHFIEEQGRELFRAMGLALPEYRVDLHLVEGELRLGNHTLQVIHTPGHAPGSICLYWQERKILFSGDVIFDRSLGRTDLPGGNGALLQQSIDRLAELDVELLLPGHGPPVQGKAAVKENFYLVRSMFFSML
ncbi:MAG: MBL fold metallo-hydrolase [Deltaproteobacteria bacterium]|nr:MBL fold metallo-hydrolase [Deltaproteobacteria bacterium]MBW2070191.1 MBL fold metallo-hydrolase [Deltaproteobacteria bacterium]